ncbi:MAG: ORC1-type DNA replication protein [Methanocorpusculum sp.]|nr:ORC1-type DNA replication protein [Methanocorpusculum sp.]
MSEDNLRPHQSSGLFKKFISTNHIFRNREVLRHSYNPRELPHRLDQIDSIAEILAPALQGATPSNILIYGKTGTGKTATVKFVGSELENESSGFTPCRLVHLNCETIDTQYRVLAQIANHVSGLDLKPSDRVKNTIPPTGWHTDQVYSELKNILEQAGGLQIIVLDEIDKLVKKSGDDTLYSLTRINSDLVNSRVCIIGISNDLTFKDFLDPRVLSSLSEEELVFPPYNADQLRDILHQRAETAFLPGAVSDEVIGLCAARAAQEHGDARRALDLLRVSGELAEREGVVKVSERHVALAQESIETDTMSECVKTLPIQSKIVLCAMLLLNISGQKVFTSSSVINVYRELARELDTEPLSHRRVSDLINDLTMLGIVTSRVVSHGRYGRATEIYFKGPTNDIRKVIMNEPRFSECSILHPLIKQ